MDILQAIIIGIIQGLTEFLPVSSTAHLLITERLLGIHPSSPEQANFLFIFDVLVQMGTLLALIIYFRRDLLLIARAVFEHLQSSRSTRDLLHGDNPTSRLGWLVLLATIPALAAGALLQEQVEKLFQTPLTEAAIRLTLTTVLLLAAEILGKRTRILETINWKDALWIGCFQMLSVFPGASRSGSTIAGGMTRHLERSAAARFAFLLSIPVMLVAGAYQGLKLLSIPSLSSYLLPVLVGMFFAAITGYMAIGWLMKYVSRHSLYPFIIYCAGLGLLVLIL